MRQILILVLERDRTTTAARVEPEKCIFAVISFPYTSGLRPSIHVVLFEEASGLYGAVQEFLKTTRYRTRIR
jgi:hypothetical protein